MPKNLFTKILHRILNPFRKSPKNLFIPLDNIDFLKEKGIKHKIFLENDDENNKMLRSALKDFVPKNENEKRFLPFKSHLEGIFLEIDNPKFYFAQQHLLDEEHHVWYHKGVKQADLPIFKQKLPFFTKKLTGTIAYLCNTPATHYGHWLRLVLPLLRIYERDFGLEKIDYFYVGDAVPARFVYETLGFWGISPKKIIYQPCKADKYLAFFSYWERQNGDIGYLDKESFEYVRQKIFAKLDLSHNCCYAPNIYIARGDVAWRKVRNEENLLKLLAKYNIEYRKMDNLSVEEQAKIFYFAQNIIAPHGSALTNLMFSNGANVLEFFSKNHLCHTSYTLATYAHANYTFKQDTESDFIQNTDVFFEDLEISEEYLEKWIKKSKVFKKLKRGN